MLRQAVAPDLMGGVLPRRDRAGSTDRCAGAVLEPVQRMEEQIVNMPVHQLQETVEMSMACIFRAPC